MPSLSSGFARSAIARASRPPPAFVDLDKLIETRERAAIRKPDGAPAPVVANARLVAGRRADVDSVSP